MAENDAQGERALPDGWVKSGNVISSEALLRSAESRNLPIADWRFLDSGRFALLARNDNIKIEERKARWRRRPRKPAKHWSGR